MPPVIVVTGSRGSGKSTLIKALFPELDVDFSEVKLYRVYELASGLQVAEICGKPEALSELVLSRPSWQLYAGIVVVDGAQPSRVDGRALALVAGAPRRALVMSKADVAPRERTSELKTLAQRFKFEFFPVSAAKGEGIGELKAWLLGIEAPRRAVEEAARAAPPFDVVPVPAPVAAMGVELSEDEKLVLKLCDGKRGVGEIARELGIPYGRVRMIVDRLYWKRYIRELRLKVSV
ncbi:MAG: hypothetical protein QXF46_08965 [Thermofilaceae archaeon]